MKIIQAVIFNIFLIVIAFHNFFSFAAEEKVIEIVTTSTQAVLQKAVDGLAIAGPYMSAAIQAYRIGEEIRKHNFPTIKEKVHAEEVAERFTLLTAENALQKCFIDNRSSVERNKFGRPLACEDIAQFNSMIGGANEVARMTAIYNQYRT